MKIVKNTPPPPPPPPTPEPTWDLIGLTSDEMRIIRKGVGSLSGVDVNWEVWKTIYAAAPYGVLPKKEGVDDETE